MLLIKKSWKNTTKIGGLILADRYTTANMVHQAGKIKDTLERQKFLEWLWNLEFIIYKIPVPDKVFFLNMPINFSLKLIENRKNKFDENATKDIHESDKQHLIDSYNAACEVAKTYNWNEIKCVKDEILRTKEDIGEEIFKYVEAIL